MTLVEFLRERLNEDERIARAATPGQWLTGDGQPDPSTDGDAWDVTVTADGGSLSRCSDCGVRGGYSAADAAHIVAWQPSRVLADIAGKRAILDRLDTITAEQEQEATGAGYLLQEELEDVAAHLAQQYASHADFRPEWLVSR